MNDTSPNNGLLQNVRPGAVDVTGQQRELFPFDAFEYIYDEATAAYRVRLKEPWQFEIEGLSAQALYEALSVDPANVGNPTLTTWSGTGNGRLVELRASYPAGLTYVPQFDVQISVDQVSWFRPAFNTANATVWNTGAGFLTSRSSNFIQGPMPLDVDGGLGTPLSTTYYYRFRTYNPLTDATALTWSSPIAIVVNPVQPGDIQANAVTAETIEAGAVTALKITASEALIERLFSERIYVDALFAKAATVSNSLTIGASGQIVSLSGEMALVSDGNMTLGAGSNIMRFSPNDATYRLWVGDPLPASAPFSVDKTGYLRSTSGKIGGWTIEALALTSRVSGVGAGVTLDEDLDRVSIFSDADDEVVVMGYLNGLPKNNGTGSTWSPGDRGFWVRAGDRLVIDGDVEYVNGDWLIENDASYLINNGTWGALIGGGGATGTWGATIGGGGATGTWGELRGGGGAEFGIPLGRFGTFNGRKGVFINERNLAYDVSTGKPIARGPTAELSPSRAFVGNSTNWLFFDGEEVEVAGRLVVGGVSKTIDTAFADVDTAASGYADAAETDAIAAAALDATDKAGTAETNAIDAAAIDATNKATTAQTNAQSYAEGRVGDIAVSLGYDNITALEAAVGSGTTIIDGGLIRTSLIETDALWAMDILVGAQIRSVGYDVAGVSVDVIPTGFYLGSDGRFRAKGARIEIGDMLWGPTIGGGGATGTWGATIGGGGATGTWGELRGGGGSQYGERGLVFDEARNELVISGRLVAADGVFSGDLRAATGTFAGALTAATGTFAGELTAATGTFAGLVSGGSIDIGGGDFTVDTDGNVVANNIDIAGGTISGSITATGTITGGTISGGTISGGTVSGASISSGTITIGAGFSVDASGNLTATNGNFSGTLSGSIGSSGLTRISPMTGTWNQGRTVANGLTVPAVSSGVFFSGNSVWFQSEGEAWLSFEIPSATNHSIGVVLRALNPFDVSYLTFSTIGRFRAASRSFSKVYARLSAGTYGILCGQSGLDGAVGATTMNIKIHSASGVSFGGYAAITGFTNNGTELASPTLLSGEDWINSDYLSSSRVAEIP